MENFNFSIWFTYQAECDFPTGPGNYLVIKFKRDQSNKRREKVL